MDSAAPRQPGSAPPPVGEPASVDTPRRREAPRDPRPSFRQRLSRRRWVWFVGIVLLYLLSFNGQWLATPDSALYRSLGRNLAAGHGYTYLGQPHDHAFPGLPRALAGSRQLLGSDLLPALVVNMLMVFAGLGLLYATLRRDYPRWVATAVVILTAANAQLLQYTARVLTDVPFLFAVCLTLYAQRRLMGRRREASGLNASDARPSHVAPLHEAAPRPRAEGSTPRRAGQAMASVALLALGVTLASLLRPAFWVLVVALGVWIGHEVWRGGRGARRRAAWVIGALAVAGVLWRLLDTRAGGKDESRLIRVLGEPVQFLERLSRNLPRWLTEHGMDVFFGSQLLPGLDVLLTLMVMGGGVALLGWPRGRRAGRPRASGALDRRDARVFQGALVLVALGVTLLFAGTMPRYYLMVLPLLALGWVQCARWLAHRLPRRPREYVIAGMIVLPLVTNGIEAGVFVLRQHQRPFIEHFEHGYWVPYRAMAEAIREHVPADQRVIGPQPRVLSFWSGREVGVADDLLGVGDRAKVAAALEQQRVAYVVLPLEVYKHQAPLQQRLLETLSRSLGRLQERQAGANREGKDDKVEAGNEGEKEGGWVLVQVRPHRRDAAALVAVEVVARGALGDVK